MRSDRANKCFSKRGRVTMHGIKFPMNSSCVLVQYIGKKLLKAGKQR